MAEEQGDQASIEEWLGEELWPSCLRGEDKRPDRATLYDLCQLWALQLAEGMVLSDLDPACLPALVAMVVSMAESRIADHQNFMAATAGTEPTLSDFLVRLSAIWQEVDQFSALHQRRIGDKFGIRRH